MRIGFLPVGMMFLTVWLRRPWLLVVPAVFMIVLLVAVMGVGASTPPDASDLDVGDCSQPCWWSFQPGKTTVEEMVEVSEQSDLNMLDDDELLRSAFNEDTGWFRLAVEGADGSAVYTAHAYFLDEQLVHLDLIPYRPLTLAQAFAAFGTPSHVRLCSLSMGHVAYLVFLDGSVEVWAFTRTGDTLRVRPEMQLFQVSYHRPFSPQNWPSGMVEWHGFGRTGYDDSCGS